MLDDPYQSSLSDSQSQVTIFEGMSNRYTATTLHINQSEHGQNLPQFGALLRNFEAPTSSSPR